MDKLIIILCIINGLIILLLLIKVIKLSKFKELDDEYKSLSIINQNTLKNKKDYDNHIEIIDELIRSDQYEETLKYIKPIYKGIDKASKLNNTKLKAFNSLLQVKLQQGLALGVKVQINISTDLSLFKFEEWKLCRVVGNIIDNALYALNSVKEKDLIINIDEDIENYKICVENTGEKISNSIIKNIFKIGFTTKKDRGDGMGLYIAKGILDSWKGEIYLDIKQPNTVFIIEIPKGKL